jgi:hypothetical protein
MYIFVSRVLSGGTSLMASELFSSESRKVNEPGMNLLKLISISHKVSQIYVKITFGAVGKFLMCNFRW